MNTMQPLGPALAPIFDDDVAIARAVAETKLPESKVRAVVEAEFWFGVCVGAIGVQGCQARIVDYFARFPNMFEGRDEETLVFSNDDEATFVSETTDVFEDETTRVLLSIRAYEAEIGIIDPSAVDDYRAWRVEWLTYVVRPRFVKVDGKFVVYSFAEALRREQNSR